MWPQSQVNRADPLQKHRIRSSLTAFLLNSPPITCNDEHTKLQSSHTLCVPLPHPRCIRRTRKYLVRLGFPGALPQRRVVWMWFGAFPGAFGTSRSRSPGPVAAGTITETSWLFLPGTNLKIALRTLAQPISSWLTFLLWQIVAKLLCFVFGCTVRAQKLSQCNS